MYELNKIYNFEIDYPRDIIYTCQYHLNLHCCLNCLRIWIKQIEEAKIFNKIFFYV